MWNSEVVDLKAFTTAVGILVDGKLKGFNNSIIILLQLQRFPKFFKILDPPCKFYLAWICFGLLNFVVPLLLFEVKLS